MSNAQRRRQPKLDKKSQKLLAERRKLLASRRAVKELQRQRQPRMLKVSAAVKRAIK